MTSPYLLFENLLSASPHRALLFSNALQRVVCRHPDALKECLEKIDDLRQTGHYLAGYIGYGATFPLLSLKSRFSSNIPLLDFYAFQSPQNLSSFEVQHFIGNASAKIQNLKLTLDLNQYTQLFQEVKKALKRGDSYQMNLTSQYQFHLEGTAKGLYQSLRHAQTVSYAGLIETEDLALVSLSPELFFRKKGNLLTLKPMKGTTPRFDDSKQDKASALFLQQDPKSIAENTMIVDLLRNDAAKISKPGSVEVSQLHEIESFQTVHQMTSTIHSHVDKALPFSQLTRALFPCGSITGAPKKRTVQLLDAIEQQERGLYTGSMGYITPQNDMCFNVLIRSITLNHHHASMGVGGGIVMDSDVNSEFNEMKLKARFIMS